MNTKFQRSARRRLKFLQVCFIFLAVLCSILISILIPTPTRFLEDVYQSHMIGGFSIITAEQALSAMKEGIQIEFQYGNPPSENDAFGQTLQSLHMHVVDGFISSSMHYYECQRLRTMLIVSPPYALNSYCGQDSYPTFASEDAFLATIATHLRQVMHNHLIVGYWVLDDWASWDEGSARLLLTKIRHLIQHYTPGRPAICGFGGTLSANTSLGWNDNVADNFSPQGCDEVGLYIYSARVPIVSHIPSSSTYDWSMSKLLPAMFASLKQRRWNIQQEPLLGIVQAIGGPVAYMNSYQVPPTAQDIETQSRSFCESGATGLTFYGWSDSSFGALSQTPMNSPEVEKGIRDGIAACKQSWNKPYLEDYG